MKTLGLSRKPCRWKDAKEKGFGEVMVHLGNSMEASGAGVEGAEGRLVEEEAAMRGARTAGSVGLLGPRLYTGCGGTRWDQATVGPHLDHCGGDHLYLLLLVVLFSCFKPVEFPKLYSRFSLSYLSYT